VPDDGARPENKGCDMSDAHTIATFLAQLTALLVAGRLLGEGMARVGQPAIFGQLLGGVLLGPSVLGILFPDLQRLLFPDSHEIKTMMDAVSQIGILMLLLLTGMEANLKLVTRRFNVVAATSISGIAIPFLFGVTLGYLLPVHLVPDPARQHITALFLGTALSVSSVKIVAMVLMEVGFIRRDLGQLMLATAILDDTIAWILLAVIVGMAAQGETSFGHIGLSLAGVVIFLITSLTVGRRVVAWIIRWTNDSLSIEFPVITAILIVTMLLAITTEVIGVHSALGAFIAGILIGQSPILTKHIEGELRGFIIAFFGPVFFALAGLGMNLTTLGEPRMLCLALAFIAIATVGKGLGALVGGRLAGLNSQEALALAAGLNARGSTEVIVATIGLTMGVLNRELYTLIVAMAIITTIAMPPTLRGALGRAAMRPEEQRRLEKEDAEADQHVPKMERVLVLIDESRNGAMAARLAGTFSAGQKLLTTVVTPDGAGSASSKVVQAAEEVARRRATVRADANTEIEEAGPVKVSDLIILKSVESEAIEKEAAKGYSIAFVGIERPLRKSGDRFVAQIDNLLAACDGPLAIAIAPTSQGATLSASGHIMIPTGGSEVSRLATEIAIALARASDSGLTVVNVVEPNEDTEVLRGRTTARTNASVLKEVRSRAERAGVNISTVALSSARPNRAILRMSNNKRFDLMVVGIDLKIGEKWFVGPRSRALIRNVRSPLLLIVR
jgi:Kef-type K+ transport system membrane component KefB/nucleotide-binding universal stress UspA family protein